AGGGAMAPRKGLMTAISTPEVDCVNAHAAWPCTGSPTMTLAKYGAKMKVVTTVKKGWLAQSNSAQLNWPSLEASRSDSLIRQRLTRVRLAHDGGPPRQDVDHGSGECHRALRPKRHTPHRRR